MNPFLVNHDDRIAIIGAGVAGIATAAALHCAGYTNIIVYDKHTTVGGLWVENYPNAAVQSSPCQYEYPGYKYPDSIRNRSYPPAPTGEEVRVYLYNFCKSQEILDKFQFNTSVSKISRNHSTGVWTMEACTTNFATETTTVSVESFAFVVMCTGLFSSAPNMITIPGSDAFLHAGGRILHSSQWKDMEEFRNQNVIIIGNGKSAADVAIAASKMAKLSMSPLSDSDPTRKKEIRPPIQCIRKQTWYIPRCLMRFKFLFHSRLVGLFFPCYYEETSTMAMIIHCVCHPVKYVSWRLLEIVLTLILRLPRIVRPKFGTLETENALSTAIVVTDGRHLNPIRTGELDLRVTQVQRLTGNKEAHLSDGTIVPVDIAVMGTGWKLEYSLYDEETVLSHLDTESDGLWLYRNVLPPDLPGIAFVGSNTETSINIFTSYVQAYWLVHLISGRRAPVTKGEMKQCVEREKIFKRKYYPTSNMRASCIAAYMQHYHDLLFIEQEINPFIFTGIFGPINNLLCPMLPETMASSFNKIRSEFYGKMTE